MRKPILIIGTFDTKGAEYAFLREQIITLGGEVLTVNVGVLGSSDLFPVDIETDEVVRETGADLASLRQGLDRGKAIKIVGQAAAAIVSRLYDEGQFAGIIGMGGSGGSTIVTFAMRALPYGVPKICVSTVAGGDTSPYVGAKDVTMIPAITDVAGVNRISRTIFTRAAGAIVGMV
ncbi:MAG: Tm-1-like ATP-binding domain-containing protein, partial [Pirellulales bacterium]